MGMTEEQYWEKDPYLAVAYRKAYRLKRETDNEQAWLQGLYVYYGHVVSLTNAFAKQGTRKQNYLEKPIDLFPLTEAQKKQRAQEEQAKMQEKLEAMIRKQRQQKKQKGE